LNHFWPHRPAPKGFSIDKLANKCREKIYKNSRTDSSESDIDVQVLHIVEEKEINSSGSFIHWANRTFAEYQEAA
tara:strand:+ start:3852 stop:4076 length:225 start_codon:yes stop_codon:yes gene_type:complete